MSKRAGAFVEGLSEVQELVDDLAADLGRSVTVDNPEFEFVCASAQTGPIDGPRIAAIIDRAPPRGPLPWLLGHGIETATSPVRIAANEEHGLLARICFPVRGEEGELLAYLWLFDEPRVEAAEVERTLETVAALAAVMIGGDRALLARVEEARAHADGVLASRAGALEAAIAGGYLAVEGELLVHVARLADAVDGSPRIGQGALVRRLLAALHRGRPGCGFLLSESAAGLVVIERSRGGDDTGRTLRRLERAVADADAELVSVGSAGCATSSPIDACVRRARFSAEVAALIGHRDGPLAWEDLGAWRPLIGWSLDPDAIAGISPDAERLLSSDARDYADTLVAYLDHARNTTETSGALFIHRATLHYRLQRVRAVLGDEALDDGWRATALHIALRLHSALQDRALQERALQDRALRDAARRTRPQ